MQSQPRMVKALSCQVLRASRDRAHPASWVSLSALLFPSIQLECLVVQGSPLALSLGCSPHRLGQAALGALGTSLIQAQQGQFPQACALPILVASAWAFPGVLMSGWSLEGQRWRQCCAADYGVNRGV